MINVVYNMDCMEYMATKPDKYYELAIVDPEYGNFSDYTSTKSYLNTKQYDLIRKTPKDNRTESKYFKELFRISKHQIIWGMNYFISELSDTKGLIIWDKKIDGNTLLNWAEIAWQNIIEKTKIFRFHNMECNDARIHRNQKPIHLYKWLLENYTKPGDKIFDSHVGSGSSRCAAYEMGFDFEGTELDADYWQAQEKRFEAFKAKIDGRFYLPNDEKGLFN